MYFPLFVGVLCLFLFCYVLLFVHSIFAIILKRKMVAFIVLQMYCYYAYSVTLPHDAVGWFVVCDAVLPDYTN